MSVLPPPVHPPVTMQPRQQLALPAPPPADDNQQIQIIIDNSGVDTPATNTLKQQENVSLGLIVEDIQDQVTVKAEDQTSINREISNIAGNLQLDLNDSDNDDIDNSNDTDMDGNPKLTDQDVVSLPIEYLKLEDLERHKKLLHQQHQARYLSNLVKKKEKSKFLLVMYLVTV